MDTVKRYGGISWFGLGDRDLGTHLYRTQRRAEGATLTEVTAEITDAWDLGLRLLPVTDDRLRTMVTLGGDGDEPAEVSLPGVLRAAPARRARCSAVRFDGAEAGHARPRRARGHRRRRHGGDRPVEPDRVDRSGAGRARRPRGARSPGGPTRVAVSPIVAGAALKGPADRLLTELGHEATVVGDRPLYAPLAATLVIDEADAALADAGGRRGHPPGRGREHHAHPRDRRRPRPHGPARERRSCSVSELRIFGADRASARSSPATTWPGSSPTAAAEHHGGLLDGDVVVVTQKIVSKAEGQLVAVDPDDPLSHKALVEAETVRVLRRRGDLVISETKHGFVCANAGIDLSNVERGYAALLPEDSDRSARRIRDGLRARAGVEVAVIVSDTFGRTWRRGLTDVAIGCAGIGAIVDYRGTTDTQGRELQVTEVAVVDELAGAADLVMGKATGLPVAVVRGVDPSWLRAGSVHDEIVRDPAEDLFR